MNSYDLWLWMNSLILLVKQVFTCPLPIFSFEWWRVTWDLLLSQRWWIIIVALCFFTIHTFIANQMYREKYVVNELEAQETSSLICIHHFPCNPATFHCNLGSKWVSPSGFRSLLTRILAEATPYIWTGPIIVPYYAHCIFPLKKRARVWPLSLQAFWERDRKAGKNKVRWYCCNHLACEKPCKKWHIYHINWWSPDFWTINSTIHQKTRLCIMDQFLCLSKSRLVMTYALPCLFVWYSMMLLDQMNIRLALGGTDNLSN